MPAYHRLHGSFGALRTCRHSIGATPVQRADCGATYTVLVTGLLSAGRTAFADVATASVWHPARSVLPAMTAAPSSVLDGRIIGCSSGSVGGPIRGPHDKKVHKHLTAIMPPSCPANRAASRKR